MHCEKCGSGLFPGQFALAGSLLASEYFHLVLSGYVKLSHNFSNSVFMTSSLFFSIENQIRFTIDVKNILLISYLDRYCFQHFFIEIIFYFPLNHVRSLRGCLKWGNPRESVKTVLWVILLNVENLSISELLQHRHVRLYTGVSLHFGFYFHLNTFE